MNCPYIIPLVFWFSAMILVVGEIGRLPLGGKRPWASVDHLAPNKKRARTVDWAK